MGIVSYQIATELAGFPHFNRIGQPIGPDVFLEFHIILSTVGMALLVALIVVYARTYVQTKANFILGLLVVLFALLLQALFDLSGSAGARSRPRICNRSFLAGCGCLYDNRLYRISVSQLGVSLGQSVRLGRQIVVPSRSPSQSQY